MNKPMTIETLADLADEMQDYTPDPAQLGLLEKAAVLLRRAAATSQLAVAAVGLGRRGREGY